MEHVPFALLNIVFEYGDGDSLLKLLYVAKKYNIPLARFVRKKISDIVVRQLTKHFSPYLNVGDFLREMKKSKGVISGSFLIHCIYPEIEFGDLDVFIQEDENSKPAPLYGLRETPISSTPVSLYLNSRGLRDWRNVALHTEAYWGMFGDPSVEDKKFCRGKNVCPNIKYVTEFSFYKDIQKSSEKFCKNIQLVHCRILPRKFIKRSSDFECSKCIFDGRTIHISDASILSLLNRTIQIKPHTDPSMKTCVKQIVQYYRWQKYTKKGFYAHVDPVKYGNTMTLRTSYPPMGGKVISWMVGEDGCLSRKRNCIRMDKLGIMPTQKVVHLIE